MKRLFCLMLLIVAVLCGAQTSYAALIDYNAALSGAKASPPNASPATGTALVTIDTVANTMTVDVTFSGLLGITTAAHIHGPTALPGEGTAGVETQTPTFLGFPLGVTSGTYHQTFDLTQASTYNPAFMTANGGTAAGAESAFLASLADNKAYFNVHTNLFPGGEIRGFLQPSSVPEPATMLFLCLGIVSAVLLNRKLDSRTI